MSPIGPLVFVLSLLLISETAEAEETMDPLTLIRKTLKYWHSIYKEYNDEVILGYCWAEYVLGVTGGTSNPPMSRSTFQNHSDVEATGYDQTKTDIIDEDPIISRKSTENWTSQDVKARRKRSRETLNSRDWKEDSRISSERHLARNIGGRMLLTILQNYLDVQATGYDQRKTDIIDEDPVISRKSTENSTSQGVKARRKRSRETLNSTDWKENIRTVPERRIARDIGERMSRTTFQNHLNVQATGYDQTKTDIIDEDPVLLRKNTENWTSQEVKTRRKRSRETLNSTDWKENVRTVPERRIARDIGERMSKTTFQNHLNVQATGYDQTKTDNVDEDPVLLRKNTENWTSQEVKTRRKHSRETLNSTDWNENVRTVPERRIARDIGERMSRTTFQNHLNVQATGYDQTKTDNVVKDIVLSGKSGENWTSQGVKARRERSRETLNSTDLKENVKITPERRNIGKRMSRTMFQDHWDVQATRYDQTKTDIMDENPILSRKSRENWTSQDVKARRQRSRETSNSTDSKEDIKIVPERRIARNIGELFAQQFPTSDAPSKTPVTWREGELYGRDSRYTLRDLTSTKHPQDTFRHSYRSSEFSRIGGHVSSSFSVPFSSLSLSSWEKLRTSDDGRLSNRNTKIVKGLSHLKFEGNGVEDDRKLRGRSEDLEADIHRKLLYRKMNHATFNDDSSVERMFSLKLSREEQQKSLSSPPRSVLREDTFLNDLRFKKYNQKSLQKAKKKGFPNIKRKANSYNSEFQIWKEDSKYSPKKSRFKRDTNISNGKSSTETSSARNLILSATQSNNTVLTIVTSILKLLRSLLNVFSHLISRKTDSNFPLNPEVPMQTETYPNHPYNFNKKYFTYQNEQINPQLQNNLKPSKATTNDNHWQRRFFTENSPELSTLKETQQREKSNQSSMRISSLLPVMYQQFIEHYDSWTKGTNRNSRASRSSRFENQNGESSSIGKQKSSRIFVSSIHSMLSGILRTLGLFVQVGRQIIDYVETNRILACTKDYVWTKIILWIES